MAAVAFGSRSVQQEKVDSMTQWKRRFRNRGLLLIQNNTRRALSAPHWAWERKTAKAETVQYKSKKQI